MLIKFFITIFFWKLSRSVFGYKSISWKSIEVEKTDINNCLMSAVYKKNINIKHKIYT